MNDELNYKNNPLHGLSLKNLLIELVDHYGFEILDAYLNINCFKTKPSIESSVKFLKKTEWARHKIEVFYLYEYKNLPRASSDQFALPPRDRIIPDHHQAGEPAKLSLEDAARLHEKRTKKAAERGQNTPHRPGQGKRPDSRRDSADPRNKDRKSGRNDESFSSRTPDDAARKSPDPWAKWRE